MQRFVLALLLLGPFVSVAETQSTIFIVRHAEKADNAAADPGLSDAGRTRAESLAKILKDANITAIYATEFKRTQETAAPLAHALGIEVTVNPAATRASLPAKLQAASGNAVVVGHTNSIPDLLKTLGISTPIQIAETDYDNLFIVILGQPVRFLRLHYR